MYAITPNNPNIKVLAAFPTFPPIPKLLTNSKMETASKIQSKISLSKASSCDFFWLRFLVDLDAAFRVVLLDEVVFS
ncbi:MAG: hypothetical protein V8S28_01275 [Lachnospiraceae bacterium]